MNNYNIDIPLYRIPKGERMTAIKARVNRMIGASTFYVDGSGYRADENSLDAYDVRHRRNAYCRRLWNNNNEGMDYDYLYRNVDKEYRDTETGEMRTLTLTSPARVRHMPIVRPMLQSLISRISDRPINMRVYSVSTQAVQGKLDAFMDKIRQDREQRLQARLIGFYLYRKGVEMQEQMMAQMEQMEQQDPRIGEVLPQLRAVIEQARMMVDVQLQMTEEERQKLQNYYEYSYQDIYEQSTESLLMEYIQRNRIEEMYIRTFEEKMITDEPIIGVWWEPGMIEAETKYYRPEQVYYQMSESTYGIEELDWAVVYDPMTFGQVLDNYGHLLTEEETDYIRERLLSNSWRQSHWVPVLPDGRMLSSVGYNEREYYLRGATVPVYKVWHKEQVRIDAKVKTDEEGEQWYEIQEEGYKKRDGDKVVTRFRTDLWHTIRIGHEGDIYPIMRKSLWQPRPINSFSKVYLPLIGRAYCRFWQPHSLVWETRDIQELYNILHFKEETLILLAGVKGFIMDKSQMPEGMDPSEWIYYVQQGIAFIETVTKDGKRKNISYNQFQQYDNSISQGLGILNEAKMMLEAMVRMITGVTPQQQGQVIQTDQVGTYQMGLAMSNASVEIYPQEHERLWERVYEMLCNVFPVCYRNGTRKVLIDNGRQRIVSYPKGVDEQFAARVGSTRWAKESMERVHAAIDVMVQNGSITMGQMLQLVDMKSIHDIRIALKDFEDKMRKTVEGTQQQQQQQALAFAQQQAQMQAQIDAQIEQVKGGVLQQLEQLKGEIAMRKAQMEAQMDANELQVRKEIADQQEQTKRYSINVEQSIEAEYLRLQREQMGLEDKNKSLEMMLKTMEARIKGSMGSSNSGKPKSSAGKSK